MRVAAGRLRCALALHNATNTASGPPLSITLEARSYMPVFVSGSTDQQVLWGIVSPTSPINEDDFPINAADLPVSPEREVEHPVVPSLSQADASHTPANVEQTVRTRSITVLAAVAVAAAVMLGGLGVWILQSSQQSPVRVVEKVAPLSVADRRLRPGIAASVLLLDSPYPSWFDTVEFADSIAVVISRFDSFEFFGVTSSSDSTASSNYTTDYNLLVSAYETQGNLRVYAKLIRERDGVVLWSIKRLFSEPRTFTERDLPNIVGACPGTGDIPLWGGI